MAHHDSRGGSQSTRQSRIRTRTRAAVLACLALMLRSCPAEGHIAPAPIQESSEAPR